MLCKVLNKKNEIKAGRVFSWVFGVLFFIIGIGFLGGSIVGGILIMIFSVLIIYPHGKVVKPLKVKMSSRIKVYLVILIFAVIIVFAFFPENTQNGAEQITPQKNTNLNLENLSAEEVLDTYVANFNYNGLIDRINKLKAEKELATGYALESLETDIDYLDKLESGISDHETICKEAETVFGQEVCGKLLSNFNVYRTIKRDFRVLSKEVVDLDSNKASITLKHEMIFGDYSGTNKSSGETTYLLKKEDGKWKIYDFIIENGGLSSELDDIKKRKDENGRSIQALRANYEEIKSIVEKARETLALQNKIKTIENVRDAILLTNTSFEVVQITAIYDPSLTDSLAALGDDYVGMLDESSRIFKQVFPLNYEIDEATIVFYKTERDVYGNPTDKLLGKVTLSRSEYNKINWNGFSSKNLEKIGKVQFYGKSSIKELEDLQEQLEEQRAMAEVYARSIFG